MTKKYIASNKMRRIFLILTFILLFGGKYYAQQTQDSLISYKEKNEIINQPLKDSIPNENIKVIKNKSIFFNRKRDYTKIGISSLITIGGTVTSYLLKNESIENNNLYQQTNNQEYYDKSKKYDIYFGVSMAVTQIAFAALIYFLFFE